MVGSTRPLLLQARIYFIFFSNLAFAALQNVTVDDTASTGAVIPQFLPSASSWNQGNKCSGCLVKPDPSKAYNGTWHDTTYAPGSGIAQSIEFTFTGSALYIYFILANTVSNATTLTQLNFFMDGISVGSFVHSPTSSTSYQYNVPVYVNDSVPSGEHDMSIYPVNTGNPVLMLFDYLVYTTDTDPATASSSASQSQAVSATPSTSSSGTVSVTSGSVSQSTATTTSPSSSETPTTDSGSRQKNTAIIGGAIGGGVALALLLAFLLCSQRLKRRQDEHVQSLEGTMLEPPVSPTFAPPSPVPFEDYSTPTQVSESQTRRTTKAMLIQPSSFPTSPPSTSSVNDHTSLVEQVVLLRDEVSRLRDLHSYGTNAVDSELQPPPKYES